MCTFPTKVAKEDANLERNVIPHALIHHRAVVHQSRDYSPNVLCASIAHIYLKD